MSLNNVRFFGPVSGITGYSSATRNFAQAFSNSGINTKFVFGGNLSKSEQRLINSLNNYTGSTDIDFYLHPPPYNMHKSTAKYKIGYFYWEAETLPQQWSKLLNQVNELWIPCKLVETAVLKTNFTGKLKIIPTPGKKWNHNKKTLFSLNNIKENNYINENTFKFYSNFQWISRKGPEQLLFSYYKTFTKDDNVVLILKVNPLNIAGHDENEIRQDILNIKKKLNLNYYPPVYLITDIISDEEIEALHNTCDVYVCSSRGEGWSMPVNNAMLAGKQIICTNYSGVMEYLDDSSAHIINYSKAPVSNMNWASFFYNRNQIWTEPSVSNMSKTMRNVYENFEHFKYKGINAQKIAETMTIEKISEVIYEELKNGRRSR